MSDIKTDQGRVLWIDITRFLCAYIILSQHLTIIGIPYFLPRGIGCNVLWDHPIVPCFFFISGLFVRKPKGLINFKRLVDIIVPTIFWSVLGAILIKGCHGMGHSAWWCDTLGISLTASEQRLAPLRFLGTPTNAPLWFMICLVVFFTFGPLIKKLPYQWHVATAAACLLLSKHYGIAVYLSYFTVGLAVSNISLKKISTAIEKISRPISIVAIVAPALFILWKGCTDSFLMFNPTIYWYGILSLFCVSMQIYKLFPRVGGCMAKWGQYAFFLYVSHWPIEMLFYQSWNDCPVWLGSLFPIVLTAVLLLVGMCLARWTPKLAALFLMVKVRPLPTKHNL